MTLQEQYEKQTGDKAVANTLNTGLTVYTGHYVHWLEKRIVQKDVLIARLTTRVSEIDIAIGGIRRDLERIAQEVTE